MEEALARQDPAIARRGGNQAHSAALALGDWESLPAVGAASVRLGELIGQRAEAGITARAIFQVAFIRAQRQGSVDGALRSAEAFADVGDFALADLALGVA